MIGTAFPLHESSLLGPFVYFRFNVGGDFTANILIQHAGVGRAGAVCKIVGVSLSEFDPHCWNQASC